MSTPAPILAIAGDYLHHKTAIEPLLRERLPGWSVLRSTDAQAAEASVAVCWGHPPGTWARLRRVRMVHSIGVGVDGLFSDPALPDVPVCRVIDQAQAERMAEYALWATLHLHRGFDQVARQQGEQLWQRPPNRAAAQVKVGVMGLGQIGAHIARTLRAQRYDVRGWSRSGTPVEGIATFGGGDGLAGFLADTEVLLCVLPLTPQTEGILSARLFERLRPGAKLVHVGRGPHLVEADLLAALDTGQLGGAILDVFTTEPLPADNPLWTHPRVLVTPHMAAVMPMPDVVAQIAENCERLLSGQPLLRVAQRDAGY